MCTEVILLDLFTRYCMITLAIELTTGRIKFCKNYAETGKFHGNE